MQRPWIVSGLICGALSLILSGCGKERREAKALPGMIDSVTPDVCLGTGGIAQAHVVKFEVLSRQIPGLLGGKGERVPISGTGVRVTPSNRTGGLHALNPEGVTDSGGNVSFHIVPGPRFGDQYFDAWCVTNSSVRKQVRLVSGVQVLNDRQEVTAGNLLPLPLQVRLFEVTGQPITNIPVFFQLLSKPGDTGRLTATAVLTDANGMAETNIRTDPHASGCYKVSVEIASADDRHRARSFTIGAMAIDLPGLIIGVLGGLALFVFGMTLMSDGLQQMAGRKMKAVLSCITRNRYMAILAGTCVTAVIQSSSATTVMTVGFVNAGLLSLRQAIGVVFGANIGTTVTGQIVSFKLDAIAVPAIIMGVIWLLVSRKAAMQGIAKTILGFGLLFFGMTLMSDQLSGVSQFPSFVSFFQTFDCTPKVGHAMPLGKVLGAVAIGTLMTMIVQSSSATIGVAIVLANSGLLNIWTAIPIILGDNIGTTITAILAALNANRTAREAAVAHSLFNILGTIWMVAFFYVPTGTQPCFFHLVDTITHGDMFLGENVGRHVAMAHTLFNVTNVVLFTPFIGVLAWLCDHLVPGRQNQQERAVLLEERFLATPVLAFSCAVRAMAFMTEKSWRSAEIALNEHRNNRSKSLERIQKTEDEVDTAQQEIMDYLSKLVLHGLSEEHAPLIPIIMHCVNDAERISDLALLMARRATIQHSKNHIIFSTAAMQELDGLLAIGRRVAADTFAGLNEQADCRKQVEDLVLEMKTLAQQAMQNHVVRIHKGDCSPESGIVYVEVIAALQNIVRHLENIAQRAEHFVALAR